MSFEKFILNTLLVGSYTPPILTRFVPFFLMMTLVNKIQYVSSVWFVFQAHFHCRALLILMPGCSSLNSLKASSLSLRYQYNQFSHSAENDFLAVHCFTFLLLLRINGSFIFLCKKYFIPLLWDLYPSWLTEILFS